MAGTIKWKVLGDYAVVVVEGRPEDEAFDAWVAVYAAMASEMRGLLVHARGTGPDAQQRGRLTRMLQDRDLRHQTAVLCDSILLRGAMNAINWFLRSQTAAAVAFAPSQLDKALDHLGAPRAERARIDAALSSLLGNRPVRPKFDAQPKL